MAEKKPAQGKIKVTGNKNTVRIKQGNTKNYGSKIIFPRKKKEAKS